MNTKEKMLAKRLALINKKYEEGNIIELLVVPGQAVIDTQTGITHICSDVEISTTGITYICNGYDAIIFNKKDIASGRIKI